MCMSILQVQLKQVGTEHAKVVAGEKNPIHTSCMGRSPMALILARQAAVEERKIGSFH